MTPELKTMINAVNDWATWTPPGGRMWYDRCTEDSENGFIFQLSYLVGQLTSMFEATKKVQDQCRAVYQLTRKMKESAAELQQLLSSNDTMHEIVKNIDKLVHEKAKRSDAGKEYDLVNFITLQDIYYTHMTQYFHSLVENNLEVKVFNERLSFYSELLCIIQGYVELVQATHVFNVIDTRQKKAAFKEVMLCSDALNKTLAGWEVENVDQRLSFSKDAQILMSRMFGYDLETAVLTDEVKGMLKGVIKKNKDFVKLIKNTKRETNRDPNLWKNPTFIISDGGSDGKK